MSSRKSERLSCRVQGQTAIVSLEDMEIWDGADLSRLREILTRMIIDDGYRSVGVDLSSVKYIPSGFFGMLYEWYESGVEISLCSPRRHVAEMLWFRMFFVLESGDTYRLSDAEVRYNTPNEQVEYHRRAFMQADASDELDEIPETQVQRFGGETGSRSWSLLLGGGDVASGVSGTGRAGTRGG